MKAQALGLQWDLAPGLSYLNHGSFGLAPRELLQWRFQLLQAMERDPVQFLAEELPPRLQRSRAALASLVGTSPAQLAFVPSTTYGLNELVHRLEPLLKRLPPGSEILLPDQAYNASLNLVRFAAEQRGWIVREVALPLPLQNAHEVVAAFERAWSPATRLLVLDHITSPTALVLPLAQLIALARERGALVIVDGAHAPGSLPLQLDQLQPDAYVGNLHKWLCCPRGSAFLWVRSPWEERLRPLVVSHGANGPLAQGVSRFQLEHDWIGTADPTPWLALPEALMLLGAEVPLTPQALDPLLQAHHQLAQQGQTLLLELLQQQPLAPSSLQAAMAAVPLPPTDRLDGPKLQGWLRQHGVQVPVIPLQPHRRSQPQFLRVSCFAYNTLSDLQKLVDLLPEGLAAAAI